MARRVAVAGAGFGALVHAPAFLSEGWEVPVLWSRNLARAREQANALGVAEATDDYPALLARPDIDAVAIATPPAQHLSMVTAALDAGKHVLCEKPFALDATEARQMRDAAAAAGLTAMVAHEFRFAPQRAYIQELLAEGYIGRPEIVQAELFMGRRSDRVPAVAWGAQAGTGGGFLGGLGSHFIDGLRHWLGDVVSASGTLRTLRPDRLAADGGTVRAETDDTFTFTLTFASGAVATMSGSSTVAPGPGGRVLLSGTGGTVLAEQRGPNPEPDGTVHGGRGADRALAELPMPERFRPFDDDRDHRLMAFRLLVREFGRGIREGVSPAPNFEDGYRCQQVLDAIRASAATGAVVAIAP